MKQLLLSSIFLSLTFTLAQAQEPFDGGLGTEEDPYQVETVEQLQEIRNHTDKHFIQIADIDASDTENWNDGKGFEPIGDDVIKFTGSYDGDGYEIKGLFIYRSKAMSRSNESYIGLLGFADNAQLKNISLIAVDIIGKNE